MSKAQRDHILKSRKTARVPWHAPPHYPDGEKSYIISAACWNHQPLLHTPDRLTGWESKLLSHLGEATSYELKAWVILPNHYHLLLKADLAELKKVIGRLHNGSSTQWNREDKTPGRKVWFRFSDRFIRSERHYFACLNYLHGNPVKHGWVDKADHWPWSSVHHYLDEHGREKLMAWWRDYPVSTMGVGWDED